MYAVGVTYVEDQSDLSLPPERVSNYTFPVVDLVSGKRLEVLRLWVPHYKYNSITVQ